MDGSMSQLVTRLLTSSSALDVAAHLIVCTPIAIIATAIVVLNQIIWEKNPQNYCTTSVKDLVVLADINTVAKNTHLISNCTGINAERFVDI